MNNELAGRETWVVWNAEYNGWTLVADPMSDLESSTEGFPEVRMDVSSNRV